MQALPSISSYCKAEKNMKEIDKKNRNERSELFDCKKTLKDIVLQKMSNEKISVIQIDIDGEPNYVKLKESQVHKITEEDLVEACLNIKQVFDSEEYIPDVLVKIVTERLKSNNKSKKMIQITNKKGKSEESILQVNKLSSDFSKSVDEFVKTHTKLEKLKTETMKEKKEYVNTKKKMNNEVLNALKQTKGMTQQIYLVDPNNGLKQSMVLKAEMKEKQPTLGIRSIIPYIREAAVKTLRSLKNNGNNHLLELEFQKNIKEMLDARPIQETFSIKFSKKTPIQY